MLSVVLWISHNASRVYEYNLTLWRPETLSTLLFGTPTLILYYFTFRIRVYGVLERPRPIHRSSTNPSSTNEIDKSIRALDFAGQIDISMTPFTTTGLDSITEHLPINNKTYSVEHRAEPHSLNLTLTPCLPLVPPFFFFSSSSSLKFTHSF